jgi:predicted transcriptional regulator
MKMAVTLETIHKDIQQLKNELHRVRSMLEDEGELTDEVRRELKEAREEMDRGEHVAHEEIMAKYG